MGVTDPAEAAMQLHEQIPKEALRLVEAASARPPLSLRISGSVAVRIHCGTLAGLIDALARRQFRDIDFWAYSREQAVIELLLEGEGYVRDPKVKYAQEWGVKRLIYDHPDTRIHIDVFMDELVMAHTVDFNERLQLDAPTVPLADLLLSKFQIHEITENDLIDIVVLLADHDLGGSGEPERVDLDRIVEPLAGSWGFYYTTMQNIEKCLEALARFPALPAELADTVRGRLGVIRDRIDAEPKSTRWKIRSKVGTRSQWYETVEDVER
jgi:hypothetical protein